MLKLKRFSEGVWFDYSEGGRFKIRPFNAKDLFDLREKAKTGKLFVKHSDGREDIVDTYDDAKLTWLIFCHMLEDWQDIEVEGASTKDDIRETIFNNMEIRDWITDRSREVQQMTDQQLENELKNSESLQGGSQTAKKTVGAMNVERSGKK